MNKFVYGTLSTCGSADREDAPTAVRVPGGRKKAEGAVAGEFVDGEGAARRAWCRANPAIRNANNMIKTFLFMARVAFTV